ncbi:MAG: hypothetical protein E6G66_02935 [Actinobacteria bacterium]|nr:MAG: hypothetical protein E6G66_02935 [Actinomycetota bacterium]
MTLGRACSQRDLDNGVAGVREVGDCELQALEEGPQLGPGQLGEALAEGREPLQHEGDVFKPGRLRRELSLQMLQPGPSVRDGVLQLEDPLGHQGEHGLIGLGGPPAPGPAACLGVALGPCWHSAERASTASCSARVMMAGCALPGWN